MSSVMQLCCFLVVLGILVTIFDKMLVAGKLHAPNVPKLSVFPTLPETNTYALLPPLGLLHNAHCVYTIAHHAMGNEYNCFYHVLAIKCCFRPTDGRERLRRLSCLFSTSCGGKQHREQRRGRREEEEEAHLLFHPSILPSSVLHSLLHYQGLS